MDGHVHGHERKKHQSDCSVTHCRCEYHGYTYLFSIAFISASAEFIIALLLAHSVSAQADAIHALTHLSLYGLAFWVSWQVVKLHMDAHKESHYREKFIPLYAVLVFAGLVWVLYTSIMKLFSNEPVISGYMLLSVSVGLVGNIIALTMLNKISKVHSHVAEASAAYQWLDLDTWGDFAISLIVFITSIMSIAWPSLPIRFIDPCISIAAAFWIGWSGMQILRKKNFSHSH